MKYVILDTSLEFPHGMGMGMGMGFEALFQCGQGFGGFFVFNHISETIPTESRLTMDMVELLTMCMGYPTHHLPLETLKQALEQSELGEFIIRVPEPGPAYPALLLAARKIRKILNRIKAYHFNAGLR